MVYMKYEDTYLLFEQIRGVFKMCTASAATAALSSCEGHRAALDAKQPAKVIYPKYSKHLPYTVAYTIVYIQ